MKTLVFIAITLLTIHQSIAQNNKITLSGESLNSNLNETVDINNDNAWEKVLIFADDEVLKQFNPGEKLSIKYRKNGLGSLNKNRAEKQAIIRLKKLAATMGYPIVKIEHIENKLAGYSKNKYRIVKISGTGYTN